MREKHAEEIISISENISDQSVSYLLFSVTINFTRMQHVTFNSLHYISISYNILVLKFYLGSDNHSIL